MKAVPTTKTKSSTFDMILSAMGIALVCVATLLLNIKLPITTNGGLVHLGTGMLFVFSILFGPKKRAIAGAFTMGANHPDGSMFARTRGRKYCVVEWA